MTWRPKVTGPTWIKWRTGDNSARASAAWALGPSAEASIAKIAILTGSLLAAPLGTAILTFDARRFAFAAHSASCHASEAFNMSIACWIAARVAGVCASGFSITKSWIVPL